MIRERFAPSPTGLLHLGHAYSALIAWDAVQVDNTEFLLRIEDIDTSRCKPEFEDAIYEDLKWLGITWPTPVLRQSNRSDAYNMALRTLIELGVCYPCKCTRKDIQNALSAPQEGVDLAMGPDGPIYSQTCKHRSMADYKQNDAIRLNMKKALSIIVDPLIYKEIGWKTAQTFEITPEHLIYECGDIVLARKDIGTSYHLSVVVDDAFQSINHVTRGRDLTPATSIHRLLQALLGYPTPIYRHHELIRDENGKRLAKRDDARSIRSYRDKGFTSVDIREILFAV